MNMFPDHETFLGLFLNKGYTINPLIAGDLAQKGVLFLRHDIDFDVEIALEMARTEARLGARATYFFMLTTDSYNLLSKKTSPALKR